MNKNEIVRLAMDLRKNRVSGNFSKSETLDVLRKEMIEANGGKNYLDPQDVIFGKCTAVFEIITEIIREVKHDIMTSDPFFMRFVDYRNLELGDKNEFKLPDTTPFVVSEIADGTQALRRQRMFGGSTFTVATTLKGIKIYEEMNLLLAGRVDFNEMIDRVEKAFRARVIEDVYSAWSGAIEGLEAPYAITGSYSESQMRELVQHVKAANGSTSAYILGTMIALSKVTAAHDTSNPALESQYYNGYVGMFNGTPKMEIAQVYRPGTTEFMLPDDVVNVLASDIKPIMYVTEGKGLIIPHTSAENMDLTQELLMIEKTGVAARVPAGEGMFGRYTISG